MSLYVSLCLLVSMSLHVSSCLLSLLASSCLFMSLHVSSCLFLSLLVSSCLFMSLHLPLYLVSSSPFVSSSLFMFLCLLKSLHVFLSPKSFHVSSFVFVSVGRGWGEGGGSRMPCPPIRNNNSTRIYLFSVTYFLT